MENALTPAGYMHSSALSMLRGAFSAAHPPRGACLQAEDQHCQAAEAARQLQSEVDAQQLEMAAAAAAAERRLRELHERAQGLQHRLQEREGALAGCWQALRGGRGRCAPQEACLRRGS